MKHSSRIPAVLALSGFLSCLAVAQEPQGRPSNDTAALEKRIAELESKLAPLQKELQELRRQFHEQSPIAVIPVKSADAVQAAEVIGNAYRDTPGILVEALPKMKSVAVRADKATTNEIRDLLRRLDEAAQGGIGALQKAPVRLDDLTVLVELTDWLDKKQSFAAQAHENRPPTTPVDASALENRIAKFSSSKCRWRAVGEG